MDSLDSGGGGRIRSSNQVTLSEFHSCMSAHWTIAIAVSQSLSTQNF